MGSDVGLGLGDRLGIVLGIILGLLVGIEVSPLGGAADGDNVGTPVGSDAEQRNHPMTDHNIVQNFNIFVALD